MTPDVEKIYQQLLSEITMLEHRPGSRLREEGVSERFGLSRTPIRDVLKRLETDGLLQIQPKSGSYVTKIDLHDINAIMYIRAAVEQEAMSSLLQTITPGEIAEARRILALQENLLQNAEKMEKKDFATSFFEADNAFHAFLYEKAGKLAAIELLNATYPHFQRFRYLTGYRDIKDSENLYRIHQRILDDLEKKDPAALREDILAHNYAGLSGIQKVAERHPDWFLNID